ncbi:cupin domain-containing protein [Rhodoblastus sp. 17X3]|uniref:cupin domain-containing protein n=1 Tax=Rhodoblastus sp. 17X3 TaxID=3047026 RepID=UPI0024B83A9E|nr:cupin domain-containing protein [Rhodoblastus sp. 17X3]MDI9849219.1 cupin domain-containing protein [Rhodoblastus sp. 17X3]
MASFDGETVRIGQLDLRFLVDEKQGSGDLVMFEFTVPPGARVPAAHYHEKVDEVIFGLEGTLTVTRDGETHEISKGDTIVIPRGSVHHHQNLHEGGARALVVLNPGTIGRRYFEEIAAAVNAPGAPDPARIGEIMKRYGLVPA